MEYQLTIPGQLPGLNEYIDAERTNRYKAAKLKEQVQERIGWQIAAQLRGVRITKPVIMHYVWYEPNRRRDKDNVCAYGRKVIQDSLVAMKVLANDGWKNIEYFTDEFLIDKDNPKVEVLIVEVMSDGRVY